MIEITDELFAMPMHEWRFVPVTVNRHKWWLKMYRVGDDGNFLLCFESPKKRRYCYRTELGPSGGRVTHADVALANGETIARYWEDWGDKTDRLDAVLRITPQHIIDRLRVLLDAIG